MPIVVGRGRHALLWVLESLWILSTTQWLTAATVPPAQTWSATPTDDFAGRHAVHLKRVEFTDAVTKHEIAMPMA